MRRLLLICALVAFVLAQDHSLVKRQTRRQRPRGKFTQRKIGDLSVKEAPDTKRVVCYYTNWSVYRAGLAKFTAENINPYLCTHLVYAFGGLTDEYEVKPFDTYEDIEQGGYSKFNRLKQYNKGLKTLLAIGGWNEGSARFSELVAYPESRDNFTTSALKHLRRYNFDGLDLDWEYPASRDGSAPEDKENYAILCKELREAFEAEGAKNKKGRLLLTMAVPAGQNYIDKGFDVPALNKYLDFFNILSYDYHSAYEPTVNHHAPIMSPPGSSEYEANFKLNIDWTVNYYISKGSDRNKLVVGIPSYGRSYTLSDGQFYEFGSSASGPGLEGKYTKENGFMSFYEVCEAIASDGWQVRKPYPRRIGPFAFKGDQWVGYDDEHIVARKAEYVRDNDLGGIMFWSVDSDDFRGICNGKEYPLIEAGKVALFSTGPNAANEARHLKFSPAGINQSDLPVSKPKVTAAPARRTGGRRTTTHAPIIDPLNTPAPPTTPSPASGFKCKREGFFPNPNDCHRYFWCLNSGASGLGIVAHNFQCPANLIFNKKVDGCDHPSATVKCKTKKNRGSAAAPKSATTTPLPTTTAYTADDYDYYYYDYIEGEEYTDPAVYEQSIADQGVSNSGGSRGSQFIPGLASQTLEEEVTTVNQNLGGRTRPGYSNIQRERQPSSNQVDATAEESSPGPLNRPQYQTIERQRPQRPEGREQGQETTAAPNSLRRTSPVYVTIPRDRPSTTLNPFSGFETTLQPERKYESISRTRQRPTESSNIIQNESSTQSNRVYATLQRSRLPTTSTTPSSLSQGSSTSNKLDFLSTVPTQKPTPSTRPPRIRVPTTPARSQLFTVPPNSKISNRHRQRNRTNQQNRVRTTNTDNTVAVRTSNRNRNRNPALTPQTRTRTRVQANRQSGSKAEVKSENKIKENSQRSRLSNSESRRTIPNNKKENKLNEISTTTESYVTLEREEVTVQETTPIPQQEPVTVAAVSPIVSSTGISVRPIGSPQLPTEDGLSLRPRPTVRPLRPVSELPLTEAILVSTLPPRSERPTLRTIISETASPRRRPAARPTTPRPPVVTTQRPVLKRTRRPNIVRQRPAAPFSTTLRPFSNILEYDYDIVYYDDKGRLTGALGLLADYSEKAILLPDGSVECYDTGYFAHPDSCKRFISCSKTLRGLIKGWVYSCPSQLVFDPVGGMCNWAEAVDCLAINE